LLLRLFLPQICVPTGADQGQPKPTQPTPLQLAGADGKVDKKEMVALVRQLLSLTADKKTAA
jgi:hypothetical protein